MPEKTVGTAVVIASLFWAVSHSQKRGSTVSRAHAILKDLFRQLASDGNWKVVISDLQHFTPRACVVTSDGGIRGECLWDHCGGRHETCRLLWQQMLEDERNPTVRTPFGFPDLADVIAFAYNKTQDETDEAVRCLRCVVNSLLSQLAQIPNACVWQPVDWSDHVIKELFISRALGNWQMAPCHFAYREMVASIVTYAARMRAEFADQHVFHAPGKLWAALDLHSPTPPMLPVMAAVQLEAHTLASESLETATDMSRVVRRRTEDPSIARHTDSLASSAGSLEEAWSMLRDIVGPVNLQVCMWASVHAVSSMCTGAYTAELALAVCSAVINRTDYLEQDVAMKSDMQDMCPEGTISPDACFLSDMKSEMTLELLVFHFAKTMHGCLGFQANRDAAMRSPFVEKLWCVTHQRYCPLPEVDLDMSGLPCTDNSRAKAGRCFEERPTGPLFVIWAARLRRHQVPFAILENTPDMHLEVIQSLLGDMYGIFPLHVDMADVGHSGASRRRLYVILAHKQHCRTLASPKEVYDQVSKRIRAACHTRPSDYLTADTLEVQCEAMEVARTLSQLAVEL
ncbi:unnamed protein product [Symbiodinium necroappetens]|uniref:Uncharacterized protein n=1 Tax=Symbiodinium necroappetens TaxID=1628268 RepID=A0A812QYX7_9DINO|nr:unnamed protein product [Symbiodinium necroappetens]